MMVAKPKVSPKSVNVRMGGNTRAWILPCSNVAGDGIPAAFSEVEIPVPASLSIKTRLLLSKFVS
jgi:hypothetical protein